MKQFNLTILNINHCHSYNNLYVELKQFFIKFLLDSSYNISLSVIIRHSNNTSYIINDLHFYINDFDEVFDFLKAKFNLFEYENIYSVSFVFKVSIEENFTNRTVFLLLSYFIIAVIISLLYYLLYSFFIVGTIFESPLFAAINPLPDSNLNSIPNILPTILPESNIACDDRKFCIFNIFIDIFNKNSNNYIYFPSYFVENSFNYNPECVINEPNIPNIHLMELIRQEELLILDHYSNNLTNIINDIWDIVIQANINLSVRT